MKALYTQLQYELKNIKYNSIETIFIGGGTPSTINPSLYQDIFKFIQPYIIDNCEITTEANPNSASYKWLSGMKELGVNRVSFGVQSFNDNKLKRLNRSHSSKMAIEAIQNAYKIGFKNISLDIIYSLKSDTKKLLLNDIDIAFSLPINHISAYELTIEDGTKFANTPEVKVDSLDISYFIRDEITKRGFTQYEVSNYGIYQSVHNIGYWRLKNYIGVGAGAVGFMDKKRLYPQTDIERYISNPLSRDIEELSDNDILLERLLLGFRSSVGVDSKILNNDMIKRANYLVENNKLYIKNNIYYNRDFLLSDEVALYIMI
jgi:oxygen-independent coproporphyrinogen-3 oxidase